MARNFEIQYLGFRSNDIVEATLLWLPCSHPPALHRHSPTVANYWRPSQMAQNFKIEYLGFPQAALSIHLPAVSHCRLDTKSDKIQTFRQLIFQKFDLAHLTNAMLPCSHPPALRRYYPTVANYPRPSQMAQNFEIQYLGFRQAALLFSVCWISNDL
ncbi:hypothetical protein BDN71DRAFT_1459028, partial [Pleurotus eryngii]